MTCFHKLNIKLSPNLVLGWKRNDLPFVVLNYAVASTGIDVGPVATGLVKYSTCRLLNRRYAANRFPYPLGKRVGIDAWKWIGWAEIFWIVSQRIRWIARFGLN